MFPSFWLCSLLPLLSQLALRQVQQGDCPELWILDVEESAIQSLPLEALPKQSWAVFISSHLAAGNFEESLEHDI